MEDFDGILASNSQHFTINNVSEAIQVIENITRTTRSGGANSSIRISTPASLSADWELANLKLFEYPIYNDTAATTFDIYFLASVSAEWTADPLVTELWIECEYLTTANQPTRTIKKSTGVLDFNGTTTWQNLSVQCTPIQSGILYLRGWYAKPRESGKSNVFYINPKPVITR